MNRVAPPPSDQTHLEAALAGDRDAYGLLVARYQDRLFNTLYRMVGCREEAADLVQDAFVQAYVKLDTFGGRAQFYTWLYRIAMNLTFSQRRSRRSSISIDEAKEQAGAEPADPSAGPAASALSAEQVDLVQQALNRLPDVPRQVLVLREIEQLSYDDISEVLQIPIGTVRSRLFRARMQLKEELAGAM